MLSEPQQAYTANSSQNTGRQDGHDGSVVTPENDQLLPLDERTWITSAEVRQLTGLSDRTIREWIREYSENWSMMRRLPPEGSTFKWYFNRPAFFKVYATDIARKRRELGMDEKEEQVDVKVYKEMIENYKGQVDYLKEQIAWLQKSKDQGDVLLKQANERLVLLESPQSSSVRSEQHREGPNEEAKRGWLARWFH